MLDGDCFEFPDHPALRGAELRAMVGLARMDAVDSLLTVMADLPTRRDHPFGQQISEFARELEAHGHPRAHEVMAARAVDWFGTRSSAEMRFERGRAFFDAQRWIDSEAVLAGLAAAGGCSVACLGYRGMSLAHLGRTEEAAEILRELEQLAATDQGDASGAASRRPPAGGWGQAYRWRAGITAAMGDLDGAVLLLQQGFDRGLGFGLWLHQDPEWDPLRDHPPFQTLLKPTE